MNIGYVTLEEAEAYISTHYIETEDLRTLWDNLENEDKIILLRRSFDAIECATYTGRKSLPSQSECFPRYPETEVPDKVKYAQIENALTISDTSVSEDKTFYDSLKNFGIKSYSIGNLSESFGSASSGSSQLQETLTSIGVLSNKAQMYLKPYMCGGFRI